MYLDLMNDYTKYMHKYIWKMKVPLKIKIFMWLFHHKVLLIEMIWLNGTGMETWLVTFLISKRQSNIDLFTECPLENIIWQIVYMTLV
jgi:hypothetical protein